MYPYKAPLRDVLFSLNELHNYPAHYNSLLDGQSPGTAESQAILEEIGKFSERVLSPLYQSGDREGVRCEQGVVSVPTGFKAAYAQYVDAGWPRLGHAERYGGLPVPYSLKLAGSEFLQGGNHAWCMYAGLNDGAIQTLLEFGDEALIDAFVPKLVSGDWTATMCLTEAQSGSDLNLVQSQAKPTANGRYVISGTKIFISSGDHDMSENIVHLVLARLPDAPSGTRGLSLFVVPKRKLNPEGMPEEANGVRCVSVEKKMGLSGSATCVLAFEEAEGWLLGEPNRGLNCMFVFINKSRLGVGQQAQAHADASLQMTVAYARERLQGNDQQGSRFERYIAEPLIEHADIRRMILTQRVIAEGGRALIHLLAKSVDQVDAGRPLERKRAEHRLAVLTPICKGVLSELASEATDLGIQTLGGHGYMTDGGLEQRWRDARVTRIYEGTTGIQGMDLLGRKVLGPERETFHEFIQEILGFCSRITEPEDLLASIALERAAELLQSVTEELAVAARIDRGVVGAVAVDYLMLAGYVTLGYLWLQMAEVARAALSAGTSETAFYMAKRQSARFYFEKILPRTSTHAALIQSGSECLMLMERESLSFSAVA